MLLKCNYPLTTIQYRLHTLTVLNYYLILLQEQKATNKIAVSESNHEPASSAELMEKSIDEEKLNEGEKSNDDNRDVEDADNQAHAEPDPNATEEVISPGNEENTQLSGMIIQFIFMSNVFIFYEYFDIYVDSVFTQ